MPIVHLEPRDLSPLQAQQMIDFLNRATSAQQLARDIEFPGEPDIGIRLGQRLLDARAALGGAFTAVTQVRAVRLIGPDRFTEICIAALGFAPERWVELFHAGSPGFESTESGLALALDVRPQPAWLGQPLALTLRVADAGGTPRAGVAVTLQTGSGTLVWMYGFTRVEGQAITVQSGADGTAEIELVRAPSEPLSDVQQAALDTAFAALDASAPDPMKREADFRALAGLYLLERSYNLRRAIDIHVRDRREAMLASINPGTWRFAWPVDSVLIQADALAAGGGGNTVARAVRTVEWKNWVGAWLEFFADALREGAGLDAKFGQALGRAGSAEVLVDLLGQAQRFVADQSGRTAQWLGQKTIDAAVAKVVSSDLDNVAPAARVAVLTQFEVAAREVSPTALGSFTLVRNTRKELLGSVAAVDALSLERLNRAEALVAQVDTKAARVEALAVEVQRASTKVGNDVTRFNTDITRFNTDLADFNRSRPGVVGVTPGVIGITPVSPGVIGITPGVVSPGVVSPGVVSPGVVIAPTSP
ncbi:MAG: hypothetical protein ABIO45_01855, partial [Burkholderiaceae bacterium]